MNHKPERAQLAASPTWAPRPSAPSSVTSSRRPAAALSMSARTSSTGLGPLQAHADREDGSRRAVKRNLRMTFERRCRHCGRWFGVKLVRWATAKFCCRACKVAHAMAEPGWFERQKAFLAEARSTKAAGRRSVNVIPAQVERGGYLASNGTPFHSAALPASRQGS